MRPKTQSNKRVQLRVVKNQLARPVQAEFDFEGGVGVVPEAELVDRGVECGVIARGFLFNGQVLGRNREESIARLAGHSTLADQIRTEIRLALGIAQRRPIGREERDVAVAKVGVVGE